MTKWRFFLLSWGGGRQVSGEIRSGQWEGLSSKYTARIGELSDGGMLSQGTSWFGREQSACPASCSEGYERPQKSCLMAFLFRSLWIKEGALPPNLEMFSPKSSQQHSLLNCLLALLRVKGLWSKMTDEKENLEILRGHVWTDHREPRDMVNSTQNTHLPCLPHTF